MKFFKGTTFKDIWPVLKWVLLALLVWFFIGRIVNLFKSIFNGGNPDPIVQKNKDFAYNAWLSVGETPEQAALKAGIYTSDLTRWSIANAISTIIPGFDWLANKAMNDAKKSLPTGYSVPIPGSVPSDQVPDQVLDPSMN